jgi:hypothetical protein
MRRSPRPPRGFYARVATTAIEHRWKVLAGSLAFLALGVFLGRGLKSQFFPEDVQYWATVDVWLPNEAPISVTSQTALETEKAIVEAATEYGRQHPGKDGKPAEILHSLTTFVGGGGPRAIVMAISVAAIFLALVLQFNHAVKPLRVFAAVPYGVVGALLALAIMGTPFGFMAFLGVASLIGVIVSHVIVLFDFIEEMHEKGEPLAAAIVVDQRWASLPLGTVQVRSRSGLGDFGHLKDGASALRQQARSSAPNPMRRQKPETASCQRIAQSRATYDFDRSNHTRQRFPPSAHLAPQRAPSHCGIAAAAKTLWA